MERVSSQSAAPITISPAIPLVHAVVALILLFAAASMPARAAQSYQSDLKSMTGLRLLNVKVEPVTHQGKKGIRAAPTEEVWTQFQSMARDAKARGTGIDRSLVPNTLIVIDELEFSDGIIEVELAGAPAPGASALARGNVGVAFRLANDLRTWETIYLRPTNGRAEDQERRNHAVQYGSHPDWTFDRLRQEAASRYESYVDLVPAAWTKVKIEVRGSMARLYVHDQQQPTLIVSNLKLGGQARGEVALTLDIETIAHFRNLKIMPLRTGEK
jgi:hypothetical protein